MGGKMIFHISRITPKYKWKNGQKISRKKFVIKILYLNYINMSHICSICKIGEHHVKDSKIEDANLHWNLNPVIITY